MKPVEKHLTRIYASRDPMVIRNRLAVLEWLVDQSPDEYGTGRTTLLATAFLNQAVKCPGTKIYVSDAPFWPLSAETKKYGILAVLKNQAKERGVKLSFGRGLKPPHDWIMTLK